MKAIETVYNGYRCRSRSEARWMILMDTLKIPYTYEPEGFQFKDGTKYLPDFYLQAQDSYLEIKGVMGEKDEHKIELLCEESKRQVFVGTPDFKFYVYVPYYKQWFEDGEMKTDFDTVVAEKSEAEIHKCKSCESVYFKEMRGAWDCEICGYYDGDCGFNILINGEYGSESALGKLAIDNAKSARFEYGEIKK